MWGIFSDVVTEVVCFPITDAGFDAAAGHPFGVAARVVIAAIGVLGELTLAIDGTSELPAPDDKGVVEHATLFEIVDQGRAGLVNDAALASDVVRQVSMLVPLTNEDLSETDASLGKATG